MSLEKKLAFGACVIGGAAGFALGVDYCVDWFGLDISNTIRFMPQIRATFYISLLTGGVGATVGTYTGLATGKLINYFNFSE